MKKSSSTTTRWAFSYLLGRRVASAWPWNSILGQSIHEERKHAEPAKCPPNFAGTIFGACNHNRLEEQYKLCKLGEYDINYGKPILFNSGSAIIVLSRYYYHSCVATKIRLKIITT